MGDLDGQVAIVTGGGADLGEAIAKRFGREGATVLVVDRDATAAERTAEAICRAGRRAVAMCVDCSHEGAAQRIADEAMQSYGRIDILVNAQWPATTWSRFERKNPADFTDLFTLTVGASMRAMQAVYPHMKGCGGRIINVGSIYGRTANEAVSDAVTIDFALAGLSRAAGVEWARDSITVNFLQAAVPNVPAFRDYRRDRRELVDSLVENLPIPRRAHAIEDIGGAALFLASEDARFIVGHTIFADGGQHLTAAAFEPGATR